MAITANAGLLGIGLQNDGLKDGTITTWYRHRAVGIDLSVMDDVRTGPPEIGGIPTPTMPYKAGYVVGGGATIYPRIESTLGWWLLSLFGASTKTDNKDIDDTSVTGCYKHVFKFFTQQAFVPYIGLRKLIPHDTAASELGEDYKNCKLVGLTLNFPNDGPISARFDAMGMDFTLVEDPMTATWTFSNTYEDWQSIPIATAQAAGVGGYVKFTPSGESEVTLPVVAASATLANVPLDVRQERVYGSPKPADVTILSRVATYDLLVKWDNPDLYQQCLTGVAAGTAWSSTPLTGKVKIMAQTPSVMGTAPLNIPYKIRISSESVLLSQVGGIALASNQAVMLRFTGTAIAPSSGEYCQIEMHNKVATAYALP